MGFEKYKISKQLDKLSEQYKEFKKYRLHQISNKIVMGKTLEKKENAIYVPKVGTSQVICDLSEAKIKHHNLIQIDLSEDIVRAKYLALFFNSSVGRLSLNLLYSGSYIPHINKQDIEELLVSLPGLPIQDKIVGAHEKFIHLRKRIDAFEEEIAVNPVSIENVKHNLDRMLDSLDMLNESDKILALIREGESRELEFKSTLRKSIDNKDVPDSVIEKMTLKTIAAFMNTNGGILLVGISDKGEILGLVNDGFKSNDDILKYVKNLIKRDLGPEYYDLIDYRIIEIQNTNILQFKCKKSQKPVFLGKEEEFYIRINPATDKLSGKKQYEYIQNHFERKK